jgi:myo-inositol-1(or 4)-monophosphatase
MAFKTRKGRNAMDKKANTQPEISVKGSFELNQMFSALQRTSGWLRRDFGEVENLQQSLKGATGFVQKAAARIEEALLSDLTLVRPSAGVLTPHMSHEGDGRDQFVLAVSGAGNFVRGNPRFAISLALRSNDETKIALVYSPIDERLYYAERTMGAFVFGAFHSTRIKVSEHKMPRDLTVGYGALSVARAHNLDLNDTGPRITGCPALDMTWVAAGKFDAFVSQSMDYAEVCAAELIVAEAGGKIWEDNGNLFATNGQKIFE